MTGSSEPDPARDPEAFEVLTIDFEPPRRTSNAFQTIVHPFIVDDLLDELDNLELIDIMKPDAVHSVHDEISVTYSMTPEEAMAYVAKFNATVEKPGSGIVFEGIKA